MDSKANDFRQELESIMAEIQQNIASMREERDKIDEQLRDADSALAALRTVYEIKSKQLGEHSTPLFVGKGAPSRFAGMKLINALVILRKEKTGISKREACKILERERYNFRTNRHLSAVHFAWIALEQKEKRGGR